MVEVQRDGDSYLSNATINGRFALRACIVNYRTTAADVERLLDTIRRVAARMSVYNLLRFWPASISPKFSSKSSC